LNENEENSMGNERKVGGNEFLFEIAVFLATSARGCVDEPPLYGPLRLIDALSKLADLPRHAPGLNDDAFLRHVKAEIDEKADLLMLNPEEFVRFLDELIHQFVLELKKRT
jgi:hypothetical protein